MKRYLLLKELPGVKVGTIFEGRDDIDGLKGCNYIGNEYAQSNKDWFKELGENIKLTEADVNVGEIYRYFDEKGEEGVLLEVIKYKGGLYFKDISTSIYDGYYAEPSNISNYFRYNVIRV